MRRFQPTIAALLVDSSRNRLFHRKLAVGAKEYAHGRCHLRRQGSGLEYPATSLAEDVAIVRLLAWPIGVQWCGLVPLLPKFNGWLPFVWIVRAGKVEKSCICKGEREKTCVIGEINAETWLSFTKILDIDSFFPRKSSIEKTQGKPAKDFWPRKQTGLQSYEILRW